VTPEVLELELELEQIESLRHRSILVWALNRFGLGNVATNGIFLHIVKP